MAEKSKGGPGSEGAHGYGGSGPAEESLPRTHRSVAPNGPDTFEALRKALAAKQTKSAAIPAWTRGLFDRAPTTPAAKTPACAARAGWTTGI